MIVFVRVSQPLSIDRFTSLSLFSFSGSHMAYLVVFALYCGKNGFYTAIIGCGCVTTREITLGITLCLCSNARTHGHYTVLLFSPPSCPAVLIQCFERILNYIVYLRRSFLAVSFPLRVLANQCRPSSSSLSRFLGG